MKAAWRRRVLSRAVQGIRQLPAGVIPDREVLADLECGWGNEGFSGSLDYLTEVAAHASMTRGPILECGSGVSTILLGLLAGRRGVETWSLEHVDAWRGRVVTALTRHRIPGVRVCLSPLREYERAQWYSLPPGMPDGFSLVVCDGPVEYSSRFGLLPVLGPRLSEGSLILVDDRSEMAGVMDQWLRTMPVELVTQAARYSVLRKVPAPS